MLKETKVISTTVINCAIKDVFNFATTPCHWPEWHPTAQGVSGVTDHSLKKGEQVLEEEKFIFLKGQIRWAMNKKMAPTFWILDGIVEGIPLFRGTRVTIAYTLTAKDGQTHLKREMVYQMPNLLAEFFDALLFRSHNTKQSQRAIDRLKKVLETRLT